LTIQEIGDWKSENTAVDHEVRAKNVLVETAKETDDSLKVSFADDSCADGILICAIKLFYCLIWQHYTVNCSKKLVDIVYMPSQIYCRPTCDLICDVISCCVCSNDTGKSNVHDKKSWYKARETEKYGNHRTFCDINLHLQDGLGMECTLTGQLAERPTRGQSSRGLYSSSRNVGFKICS